MGANGTNITIIPRTNRKSWAGLWYLISVILATVIVRRDSLKKLSSVLSEVQTGNADRHKEFTDNRHSKAGMGSDCVDTFALKRRALITHQKSNFVFK